MRESGDMIFPRKLTPPDIEYKLSPRRARPYPLCNAKYFATPRYPPPQQATRTRSPLDRPTRPRSSHPF